jgi:hypothetical protein
VVNEIFDSSTAAGVPRRSSDVVFGLATGPVCLAVGVVVFLGVAVGVGVAVGRTGKGLPDSLGPVGSNVGVAAEAVASWLDPASGVPSADAGSETMSATEPVASEITAADTAVTSGPENLTGLVSLCLLGSWLLRVASSVPF